MVIGVLLLIGRRPSWSLAATAALAVIFAILGFERVAQPRISDIFEVSRYTDAVYSRPQIGLWVAIGGVTMLTLSAGLMIVLDRRPQIRRFWHHSRLARPAFTLLGLAAVLWLATYLPPGTMTSISLQAMAAIGCAVVGVVLLVAAAVTEYRS